MKINWFKITLDRILLELPSNIIYGNVYSYSKFLIYLQQGHYCEDCNRNWAYCQCNYCEKCTFNYCLCDLNSTVNFTVKDLFLNIMFKIISKNLLLKFKKTIEGVYYDSLDEDYDVIGENKYKEIMKKIEFYEN